MDKTNDLLLPQHARHSTQSLDLSPQVETRPKVAVYPFRECFSISTAYGCSFKTDTRESNTMLSFSSTLGF